MLLLNQALMMLWEAILENMTLAIVLALILLMSWIYWMVAGKRKILAHQMAALSAVVIAVIGFFVLPHHIFPIESGNPDSI